MINIDDIKEEFMILLKTLEEVLEELSRPCKKCLKPSCKGCKTKTDLDKFKTGLKQIGVINEN